MSHLSGKHTGDIFRAAFQACFFSLGNSTEGSAQIKAHPWFQGVDWFAILNQDITPPYVPTVSNIEDLSNFENFENKTKQKSKINRHPDLFNNF